MGLGNAFVGLEIGFEEQKASLVELERCIEELENHVAGQENGAGNGENVADLEQGTEE